MCGIKLPDNLNHYNCAYTTTLGVEVKIDVAALFKLIRSIPETPKLYRMDISLFKGQYLPKNSIIMSSDVVDALEQVISGEKDANGDFDRKESQ